ADFSTSAPTGATSKRSAVVPAFEVAALSRRKCRMFETSDTTEPTAKNGSRMTMKQISASMSAQYMAADDARMTRLVAKKDCRADFEGPRDSTKATAAGAPTRKE